MIIWWALCGLSACGLLAKALSCDYYQPVVLGTTYHMANNEYPRYYRANTYCRWFARSTPGTVLNLQCHDVDIPFSVGCSGDRLIVSVSGDLQFHDGHRYCGKGDFHVTTTGTALAAELASVAHSNGGRFSCTITAVRPTPQPPSCDCGWSQKPRIVGGSETAPNEYPMMAALVDGRLRILYCGSTIISTRFVVTAAHCLLERQPSEVAVLVGEHDTKLGNDSTATQLIISDQLIPHPQYDAVSQLNDIGLVRLARDLIFSKDVGPVCLPLRFSSDTFQGQLVTVLGWGRTDFGGPLSTRLKQAQLSVIDIKDCAKKLHANNITDKQMCTFANNQDACQSDSGGPVLWQDPKTGRLQLAGIISYGIGCATSYPGVNTRVGPYLTWIKTATGKDDYCVK